MSDGGRPDEPGRPGEVARDTPDRDTPAPAAASSPAEDERAASRPRWLLPVAIGAGVLVVAAVVVGIVLATNGDDEAAVPEPVVATTIRLPSPTPSVEPVAREATTAFAKALPTTVLQYALASSQEAPKWLEAGALEAYVEGYTDGGEAEVTVQAGQLETAEAAKAYAQTLTEDLPLVEPAQDGDGADDGTQDPADDGTGDAKGPDAATEGRDQLPQTGPVRVGDQRVGTYTAADLGDGTAVVVWSNGTGVFRVVAPVEDALDFYRAYPL